jgi:class 3 adenylate cyclase
MTSTGHYDSDRALDFILAAGEAEELARIQAGLRLDAGLTAITQGSSPKNPPRTDNDDSGEPQILPEPANKPTSPQFRPGGTREQHCVLFAVDVAGFTDHERDAEVQQYMRRALFAILTQAFEASQLGWDNCQREDRGDGVLVIIPAGMPSATVVDPLLDRIRTGLRHHNRLSADVARIRLRAAIHSGQVHRDEHGVTGAALHHLFRLLDAPVLKNALARSTGDLALVVSDHFYDTVIRNAPGMIDPKTFQPATVEVKETRARGWLHLPQIPPRLPRPQSGPQTPTRAHWPTEAELSLAGTEIRSFRWVPGGR